jgi:hypothetical protein
MQMAISLQNYKIMFSGSPGEEIFPLNASAMEGN